MKNSSQNEKQDRRRIKKIFILIIITVITGTVLVVETYAWFVGITTVNVDQFTVTVASETGLELSLDATDGSWTHTTLTVSEDAVTTNLNSTYSGKTNKWTSGLSPISTSGVIDVNKNALQIYGKSALASTGGGYRLISARIANYTGSDLNAAGNPSEKNGYIAFDLFIRNGTGDQYDTSASADTEAIYLSRTSTVVITPAGTSGGSEDYGLENSVRVAFAQIGRIGSDGGTAAEAQAIKCTPPSSGNGSTATGLCTNNATIWEPNDTQHKAKLINYYNLACKNKTGATAYGSNSCTSLGTVNGNTVSNNVAVQTNTVNKNISASNNVDIYDGLNGYSTSISSDYTNYLNATPTFTDTMKNTTGDQRPQLFGLAANSITKVRVYIYLEGQDVDNYDLITKGKSIKINFGITKDKFDIGPSPSS